MAKAKGYDLVGVNSTGMNAFFVRSDLAAPFKLFTPEEAYFPSRNRESRDAKGRLNFLRNEERLREIRNMTVYDIEKQREVSIGHLYSIKD